MNTFVLPPTSGTPSTFTLPSTTSTTPNFTLPPTTPITPNFTLPTSIPTTPNFTLPSSTSSTPTTATPNFTLPTSTSNNPTTPTPATPYHGEVSCSAQTKKGACTKKAYYIMTNGGQLFCGMHSKKYPRQELPKRNKDQLDHMKVEIIQQRQLIVTQYQQQNAAAGRKGQVKLYRMLMMKEVECTPGYVNIFPNFKHQNRRDGYGCAALSPKSMGPVKHGQPNLPDSLNLENFHQGNKVFPNEVGPDNYPNSYFYQNQLTLYKDPVPHRHKFPDIKENKPVYSVWIAKNGQAHCLSYVQSRQFYCTFYQRFAEQLNDFHQLKARIQEGYNLQICGFDAYDMYDIDSAYLNEIHPFGHERVLYTMLTVPPEQYPWIRYKDPNFEY